jgi:formylglycine-generating enzyme required for sulfatase activity
MVVLLFMIMIMGVVSRCNHLSLDSKKPKISGDIVLQLPMGITMTLKEIPVGSFMMGSPIGEDGRSESETLHRVTLKHKFWLGEFEVTQAQYKAVMGINRSHFKGSDYPVDNVTWLDAMRFCRKLTDMERAADRLPEGYGYSLPSEAQWEYACRAGTTTAWHYGNSLSSKQANIKGEQTEGQTAVGPYLQRSTRVGSYAPNAWGLYDMHGNVWELCLDWSGELSSGMKDPVGSSSGSDRVGHGGCWFTSAVFCTSSYRGDFRPSNGYINVGFRLAIRPDQLKERGITPSVPNENRKDVRSPSVGVIPDTSKKAQGISDALYCVVDLSAGPTAKKYPVSYLNAEPNGGWTDEYKTTKLVLRRIEPGNFKMCGKYDVTLTKPFYIGVFEVTQKQYELVTGENPSASKGDMRPVEKVSYDMIRGNDAGAKWPASSAVDFHSFMGKLRVRTGIDSFDLPTEAQWEYACRAGTTSPCNNGGGSEDDLKKLGRFRFNQKARGHNESDADLARHEPDGKGGYSERHTIVGLYMPNAWGLYDMHGNVWERCLDWRSDNLSSGVTDPLGASSGSSRIHRGGSWSNPANNCTSSTRYCYPPSGVNGSIGFRIVVGPDLLKERGITPPVPNVNGRVAPSRGVLARTVVRSVEVFPHADAQNAKWKKRAPWRYTTKVPTADWAEPAFRDGTWKRTNKPLGFGKDVALMRMADRWTTNDLWLRRHFTWKAAKVTRVVFDMIHDENVEIYLNGTRILEEAGSNDRWEPFEIPVETFTSAVREGDNVLAVKVHDNGAPRYFDCGLTVEVEESK